LESCLKNKKKREFLKPSGFCCDLNGQLIFLHTKEKIDSSKSRKGGGFLLYNIKIEQRKKWEKRTDLKNGINATGFQ
jgi:hypothetical protein